ncbi:MAG: F510_1955 family glycosylhydrolase [Bacillota bacterium]|uniref:F510_1955 family glycosylhydrolase n=1 Tax=Fictibacillus sp. JL2B1089 TaxID=3399565 RepID=UPI003A8A6F82
MAKKKKTTKKPFKVKGILIIAAISLVLVLILLFTFNDKQSSVTFTDIHGVGYSNDGKKIFIPAHDGIKQYDTMNKQWQATPGEKNDYMGFSMVDDGFYSSGHPGNDSDKPDPLGIVRSKEIGGEIELLGLEGETDFHFLAAGYENHVLYAYTSMANSRMPSDGLYYSNDDAKSWNESDLTNVEGEITGIAVHPTDTNVVAISSQNKVHLSRNKGKTFEELTNMKQVTSLTFTNKNSLLVGGFENKAFLTEININDSSEKEISIPTLQEDAISYLAKNPVDKNIVFTTFKKDVFFYNGERWIKLVNQGKAVN